MVCTYNAPDEIRKLLDSIRRLTIPPQWLCDVLVVENGTTGGTEAIVDRFSRPELPIRCLRVEKQGKCHATNQALRQVDSDVVVFTDEDIVVPQDWLVHLLGRIEIGAPAVSGPIAIPEALTKPWMTPKHLEKLAISTSKTDIDAVQLIGANMAIKSDVFLTIPLFDENLGPGRLGCNEDTLFSLQMKEAGLKIDWCPEALVEHHFKSSRLMRKSLQKACFEQGQCNAYLDFHWSHSDQEPSSLAYMKARLGWLRRYWLSGSTLEGISEYEMDAMAFFGYSSQLKTLRGKPRNYQLRGLKLTNFG